MFEQLTSQYGWRAAANDSSIVSPKGFVFQTTPLAALKDAFYVAEKTGEGRVAMGLPHQRADSPTLPTPLLPQAIRNVPSMLSEYGWKLQIRFLRPSTMAAAKAALDPLPDAATTASTTTAPAVDGGEIKARGAAESESEVATAEVEPKAEEGGVKAESSESCAIEGASVNGATAPEAAAPVKGESVAALVADVDVAAAAAVAAAAKDPALKVAQASAAGLAAGATTGTTAKATGGASAGSASCVEQPAVPAVPATDDDPQLTWVITPPYMISHQVLTRDYYPSVAAALLAMKQFESAHNAVCVARLAARRCVISCTVITFRANLYFSPFDLLP